ncbi:MAG: hypothetical protein MUP22_11210, partial [Desulfobacterales bacterium]|nr:hypothetical protein [Desulfobacterales bacterium]
MIKKIVLVCVIIIAAVVLYFIAWPVPINPVAWEAPPNPGYTGPYAPNERLKGIEVFSIGDN